MSANAWRIEVRKAYLKELEMSQRIQVATQTCQHHRDTTRTLGTDLRQRRTRQNASAHAQSNSNRRRAPEAPDEPGDSSGKTVARDGVHNVQKHPSKVINECEDEIDAP